jgi:hypothetical protein
VALIDAIFTADTASGSGLGNKMIDFGQILAKSRRLVLNV